jgi:alpha-mannosidase
LTEPVSKLYLDWRDHFYGYGFGRKFISELLALKGDAARDFVSQQVARSDELVAAAARQLLGDDMPGMQALYREAAEGLLQCRKALVNVQPYFIRGWHGGLLSDQVVEGELVGYAEWGWPSRTMRWTEARLAVSERLGYKQINQVGGATWDQIADHGLTDLERWKRASAAGLIESVKGMYSDGYLEVLGPESNIRQFEYGLKAFRRMSRGVRTFMVATDDYAFHPQLPQILKSFGFEFVALRPGGPGRIKGIDCEQLLWKGLDGTCIQAVPNYETVPQTLIAGMGGINRMPGFLVAAEKAGLGTVVGGGAVDDTLYMYGEREYESLNSVVPVQAVPTTWPEYCQVAPIRPEPVFFDANDMLGYPQFWSGFGQINDASRDDRRLEHLLVAAEKFSTLAVQKGRPYPAQTLERAWKYLLSSQDHFSYGCGGPANPEGYHVGGLQEGAMRGYAGPRTPITMEATDLRWKNYAEEAGREALEGAALHLCRTEAQPASGDAPHLLVLNPLNWSRQGTAQAWVRLPSGTRQVVAFDGEREAAAVILDRRQDEALVAFHARVPSLGFRAYAIRPGSAQAGTPPAHLENQHLRVEVSPETGAIVSLFDKIRGKELLRTGEVARIECSEPQIDTRKQQASVKLDRADALASRIRVQGKLAKSSYTLLVTLAHESPSLEIELEIDYGKGAIFGFKMRPGTLLRAVFPFSAEGTRWINLPFGVYQTALDDPVMLDFCDACDGSSGVAILSDGMPGLHLAKGNVELLISDGFPPLRGVHRYRFAIYPHAGDWRAGDVLRKAQEFQEQLIAYALTGALALPFERSYLETTEGAVLSALSVSDGKMRARFYDATGASHRIETRWRIPWKDAAEVRLDGQEERKLPVEGDRIRFDLPAWKILTIAAGSVPEGGEA